MDSIWMCQIRVGLGYGLWCTHRIENRWSICPKKIIMFRSYKTLLWEKICWLKTRWYRNHRKLQEFTLISFIFIWQGCVNWPTVELLSMGLRQLLVLAINYLCVFTCVCYKKKEILNMATKLRFVLEGKDCKF